MVIGVLVELSAFDRQSFRWPVAVGGMGHFGPDCHDAPDVEADEGIDGDWLAEFGEHDVEVAEVFVIGVWGRCLAGCVEGAAVEIVSGWMLWVTAGWELLHQESRREGKI